MILNSPYISGSLTVTGNEVVTGSLTVLGGITGAITGSATSASYAFNASYLNNSGSGEFVPTGSFNTFSSSILSYTASNNTNIGNIHSTTASLNTFSGSTNSRLSSIESTTASLNAASGSAITRLNALEVTSGSNIARISALEAASGSAITRLNALEVTSGSNISRLSSLESKTGSYATTGSNTFVDAQYISQSSNPTGFTTTASLYTDGGLRVAKDAYISGTLYLNNVTVYGTQSVCFITSSQLNISSNIISVNTATPSVRFGGLAVYDSGSTGLTGSILWDSQDNQWIYSNPSGSEYDSAMFLVGPRNTGALGGEAGITCNFLSKGNGMHHMTSSGIFDDGTRTCFYGTSFISSSGAACFQGNTTIGGNLNVGNSSTTSSITLTGTSVGGFTAGYIYWGKGSQTTAGLYIESPGTNIEVVTGYNERIALSTGTGLQVYTNNGSGTYTSRMLLNRDGVTCFACQICAPSFIGGTVTALSATANGGSPSALLACSGNDCATIWRGAISLQHNSDTTISAGSSIGIAFNPLSSTGSNFYGSAAIKAVRENATANNQDTALAFWTRAGASNSTTDTEKLRITSTGVSCFASTVCAPMVLASGCVGVGTTSISSTYGTLTVAGTGITIADDGNAKLQIGRYSSTACNAYIKMGTNACSLRFTNNTDLADVVVMEKGGNVGIGTSSPLSKLSVGGEGYSGRAITAISNNADYGITLRQDCTLGSGLQIFINQNTWAFGSTPLSVANLTGTLFSLSYLGAATFACSVTVGGYLTGQGTNPGGLGASRYVIDFNAERTRFFSYGSNTSTNGNFLFNSQRCDGTNSVDIMYLSGSGNVGIGTGSPSDKLTVTDASTYTFNIGAASGGAGAVLYTLGSAALTFATCGSSNERIRITSAGCVGFGATSPTGTIHICGADLAIRIQSTSCGNIQMGQWVAGENRLQSSARDLTLFQSDTCNIRILTNSGERVFICGSNGNVGIGTTVPNARLTVVANDSSNPSIALRLSSSSYSGVSYPNTSLRFGSDYPNYPLWNLASIDASYTGASWGGSLLFFTNNDSSTTNLTERMRITSRGNIGINCSDPRAIFTIGNNFANSFMSTYGNNLNCGSCTGLFCFNALEAGLNGTLYLTGVGSGIAFSAVYDIIAIYEGVCINRRYCMNRGMQEIINLNGFGTNTFNKILCISQTNNQIAGANSMNISATFVGTAYCLGWLCAF